MDGTKYIINFLFLVLSCVLLSNQMLADDVSAECPLADNPQTNNNSVTVHNITRTASCRNGKELPGCCVARLYCEYNTSSIDLSMYGPPGFKMPCEWKDVCCPRQYILPIPLPNSTTQDNDSWDFSNSDEDDD